MVRIVTDSTCDLPRDVTDALGVTVIPLTLLFGDEALRDGVDIDSLQFFDRLREAKTMPRTSQPSVAQFLEAYEQIGEGSEDIVSVHLSSRMSGTMNSASVAREQLAGRYHIDLIDSYNVSLGLGAIVMAAAEAAQAGANREEVVAVVRAAIPRVRIVAMVETLEYLRRGGRIGRASSLLGSILNIKPLLHVEGGEMAPFEKVRTRARAVDRLVEIATEDRTIERLFVASAGDDAAAHEVIGRVSPLLPHTDIRFGRIGPIVGVHSGPGLIGVCPVKRA